MRRVCTLTAIALAVLPLAGCIFAVDVKELPYHRQAVAVDGEIYIVNLKNNAIKKLDPSVAEEATISTEINTDD